MYFLHSNNTTDFPGLLKYKLTRIYSTFRSLFTTVLSKLLYGGLRGGKRHSDRPKLPQTFLNCTMKDCDINLHNWDVTARNGSEWRLQVKQGADRYKTNVY